MKVLTTRDVVHATPRTRIIRLELGDQSFEFQPGQAVLVGLHGGATKKPYSIACSPRQAAAANALELLVQIDDHDPENPHLEQLTPGTKLDVEGPLGSFGASPLAADGDLLFVAGGTGIAPLRSMLWHVIEHQPARHIAMIQSVRSADEIAYEEELRALAEAGRLRLEVTITREGRDQWLGPRRRIDLGMLQSVLRSPQTDCVLCGPPPMIQDVSGLLVHAGIAPERIVRESFAS